MSAADVGNLFAETLGEPFSAEHRNLTDIARRHLQRLRCKVDALLDDFERAVMQSDAVAQERARAEGSGAGELGTRRIAGVQVDRFGINAEHLGDNFGVHRLMTLSGRTGQRVE
jgi:hypothetical protein